MSLLPDQNDEKGPIDWKEVRAFPEIGLERLHIHTSSLVLRNGSLLNSSIISGVHPPHASFGTLEKSKVLGVTVDDLLRTE